MIKVEFAEGVFSVDAALIAAGLGVEPRDVQTRMREETLTSQCEHGVDDAGSVISQSVESAARPRSRGAKRVPRG